MITHLATALFWLSFCVLVYTFFGYPLLVYLLALRKKFVPPIIEAYPSVTVVLAAYNESQRIRPRLDNLLSSDYPTDQLNVVVVSDGSTDGTELIVRQRSDARVQVVSHPVRSGKAQCLNDAVAVARGEIVVFGDVRQRFAPDAISRLVTHFADSQVGAVSGALMIETAQSTIGGGVDAYWRLEKFLRHAESRFDSSIGCTGAIYAIRRCVYQQIPADTLLDDVVIPMQIVAQGKRVLFEPSALAFDPQSLEPGVEKVRKQRTLAGNYQMLFRYPRWLLPWRNRLWWQLISHKYLRLAAPAFMVLMFISNAFVAATFPYSLLFYGQCAFYALAVLGGLFSKAKIPVFSIPAGFVFLNVMALSGLKHYLRGSYRGGVWPSAKN